MNFIALKMLFGDRAEFLGSVIGPTFASLLITQQAAVFVGIMPRTFSFLTDVGLPDIWVVDPQVKYIDDVKPMRETEYLRVPGIEGVRWSVPLARRGFPQLTTMPATLEPPPAPTTSTVAIRCVGVTKTYGEGVAAVKALQAARPEDQPAPALLPAVKR